MRIYISFPLFFQEDSISSGTTIHSMLGINYRSTSSGPRFSTTYQCGTFVEYEPRIFTINVCMHSDLGQPIPSTKTGVGKVLISASVPVFKEILLTSDMVQSV